MNTSIILFIKNIFSFLFYELSINEASKINKKTNNSNLINLKHLSFLNYMFRHRFFDN